MYDVENANDHENRKERIMNRPTRVGRVALMTLLPVVAAACDSTGPESFSTDELITELAVTPHHVHAFESLVTFTVAVEDPDGNPVTDFDVLQVEHKLTTASAYTVMEGALVGDFYVVEHTFEASGDHDIRVTGLRPGDAALVVLHQETSPLHAVRPHGNLGGRVIELEPNPGHIHEGDAADIQFWILDPTSGAGIAGLTPTILIDHAVTGHTEIAATAGPGGLYHAMHTFTEAGITTLGIRFLGTDAAQHVWSLPIEVHHAH